MIQIKPEQWILFSNICQPQNDLWEGGLIARMVSQTGKKKRSIPSALFGFLHSIGLWQLLESMLVCPSSDLDFEEVGA